MDLPAYKKPLFGYDFKWSWGKFGISLLEQGNNLHCKYYYLGFKLFWAKTTAQ